MSGGLILKPIRVALAETIGSVGVNAYWCEVESPEPPSVTVVPDPGEKYIDYWGTFGPDGQADVMLQPRIQLAGQDGPAIAEQLDRLLSAGQNAQQSIIDAIVANRTLGGLVDDCIPLYATVNDELLGPATVAVRVIVHKIDAEA